MATNVNAQICVRRDTAANWTSANPTLLNGEVGYDTTNNKIKIGNGTLGWNALSYLTDAAGGGGWPDFNNKALWQCEFTGAVPRFLNPPNTAGTNFPAGPDYFWHGDSDSGVGYAVDANNQSGPTWFGLHEAASFSYDNLDHWIILSNLARPGWTNPSWAGIQGANLRYTTNEFVVRAQTQAVGATNKIIIGAVSSKIAAPSGSYWIESSTGGYVGFYFKFDAATNAWTCVSRLYERGLGFVETATAVTGTLTGFVDFKIETIPHPVNPNTNYPTVKWYVNGTLQRTLDLNTVSPSILVAWIDSSGTGMGVAAASFTGANAFAYASILVDYMHLLITFTTPR